MRNDFAELYMVLKCKGLLISVFSNATLVTEEHIELFKKYPPKDIEVTVYGAMRETYEAVTRRPGSFDRFIHGLNLLMAGNVRIRLKAMAMQSNLHEHYAIAQFCLAHTKDFYRFDPQLHLRFDGDSARNAQIRMERLTPEQIVALERADEKRFSAMRENCGSLINEGFTHDGCDHLFHCGAGTGNFIVGYDGRLRLCSSLWAGGTAYDLRTGTLHDAWFNFIPRIRDLRSQRKEFLETCHTCSIANLCMWCPAHAHLETGEMDGATPYFCEVAHRRAESLQTNMRKR
ncbi:hypothetical protein SBDP2_1790001 [Syntrophobacter sp. SbD2]|nr:hypothetical protein SBDP2_1790001 [Syntrophobacter sp. SbD2]